LISTPSPARRKMLDSNTGARGPSVDCLARGAPCPWSCYTVQSKSDTNIRLQSLRRQRNGDRRTPYGRRRARHSRHGNWPAKHMHAKHKGTRHPLEAGNRPTDATPVVRPRPCRPSKVQGMIEFYFSATPPPTFTVLRRLVYTKRQATPPEWRLRMLVLLPDWRLIPLSATVHVAHYHQRS
jgi:hypothetical protein